MAEAVLDNAKAAGLKTGKRFKAFLSHYKEECGADARIVKQMMPGSGQAFLDSDDLTDLRLLMEHVKQSECLVLLQSKGVLTRPWVLLELYTAITNDVPVVALNVARRGYNYGAAETLLRHIDSFDEGVSKLLTENGADPVDVAYRLSDTLPNLSLIHI